MEIINIDRGEFVEVVAAGRLDERWAGHLADALDAVIRDGAHHIRLNLAAVSYLGSAGIRVLVGFHKKLHEIEGSFAVTEPSDMVRKILDLTRLTPMLMSGAPRAAEPGPAPPRKLDRENASYEILDIGPPGPLKCRAIGDPSLLSQAGYREAHARSVPFAPSTMGLGLGAFGSGFADCRNRYGEFLAVAGTAAYLPTDGSSTPDYLVSTGNFVPEVSVLYGVACEGRFPTLARFEAAKQARAISLSELATAALEIAGSETAAIVVLAETVGLVGACLRKSPVADDPGTSLFTYPGIRSWISFAAEPAYTGSLCLIVGVASRSSVPALDRMLRPIGRDQGITGHFHATTFPYRPIKKGEIDLNTTVKALLDTQPPQGILHLLADHREAAGAGESEFVRGACWVGAINQIVAEEK